MMTNWRANLWEIIKFVAITLLIVVPIRMFIAQPFVVSGASMDPTFIDHEYLIVDELSYHFREPARGEVIIFKYPEDPSKYFIKRIIGLPGETVLIRNSQVFIGQTGTEPELLELPGINNSAAPVPDHQITLGADEYYVLGDNRGVSLDSRYWGPLPEKLITGRAWLSLFPVARAAFLPGAIPSNDLVN